MKDMITLAFTAMLIENVVLSQFFGICPFLGVSKKKSSAVGMGLAVTAVTVISSIVAWALQIPGCTTITWRPAPFPTSSGWPCRWSRRESR